MTKRLLLLPLLAALADTAAAQTTPLYMPRDIKAAFAKGTRSPDGRPGPKYWQNRARYDITMQAAPPARDIRGRETITYFNNSPDTLKQVVLRIIQNIHKPGASRDGDASPDYLTSGVVWAAAVSARPASRRSVRAGLIIAGTDEEGSMGVALEVARLKRGAVITACYANAARPRPPRRQPAQCRCRAGYPAGGLAP